MRSKSPELMSEIKKYIEDYYLPNRQSPSTTKIAEAVGIARVLFTILHAPNLFLFKQIKRRY